MPYFGAPTFDPNTASRTVSRPLPRTEDDGPQQTPQLGGPFPKPGGVGAGAPPMPPTITPLPWDQWQAQNRPTFGGSQSGSFGGGWLPSYMRPGYVPPGAAGPMPGPPPNFPWMPQQPVNPFQPQGPYQNPFGPPGGVPSPIGPSLSPFVGGSSLGVERTPGYDPGQVGGGFNLENGGAFPYHAYGGGGGMQNMFNPLGLVTVGLSQTGGGGGMSNPFGGGVPSPLYSGENGGMRFMASGGMQGSPYMEGNQVAGLDRFRQGGGMRPALPNEGGQPGGPTPGGIPAGPRQRQFNDQQLAAIRALQGMYGGAWNQNMRRNVLPQFAGAAGNQDEWNRIMEWQRQNALRLNPPTQNVATP